MRAAVLDSPEWPGINTFARERGGDEARDRGAYRRRRTESNGCRRSAPPPSHGADIRHVSQRLSARPLFVDASNVRIFADTGKSGHVLLRRRVVPRLASRATGGVRDLPGTYVPHAIAEFERGSGTRERASKPPASWIVSSCEGFLPSPCETQLVLSFGAYVSVMCRDVVPFTDPSVVAQQYHSRRFPGIPKRAYGRSPYLDACSAWDAGAGEKPEIATPIHTDVPTLVLVGRFDPFGMPPYARQAMSTLSYGGPSSCLP